MLRSISSNWTLNVLQIGVFMVITTFTSNTLGDVRYGIWEFLVAASGPLQLLALGLPMATVRALSAAIGNKDSAAATKALGNSLSMTLVLGAIAATIGLAVHFAFTHTTLVSPEWTEKVNAATATDASLALAVLLGHVALGFALHLPYAVFDAHQDFIARNLIMGLGLLVKFAATIALLTLRADLVVLAFIQIGIAMLEFAVAVAVSSKRHPLVKFRPCAIEWVQAKALLSFSVFAFLLNMGALLAFRIDALVIGTSDDPTQVFAYGWGNKIFDPFIGILLAIGMVIMPMATTESAKGNFAPIRDAFLKWSKIATTIVMLVGGYLMVLGPDFLETWVNKDYRPISGTLLQILMLSFFLFLPVRGVALPTLMGLGHPKLPGIGLLMMGVSNLILSLLLIGPYGLVGVALGTAIPNVFFSLLFLREACRRLDVSLGEWFIYVFGRTLPATLLAGGLLAVGAHFIAMDGWFRVLGAGVAYTAVFGVLALAFIYRGDRYIDISGVTRRLPGFPS